MLLPGEKILAERLLSIVESAREQEDTISEQGKVLQQMGEMYLNNALETGDGGQFLKASALINAALFRTENEIDQKTLQELLNKVYHCFMTKIQKTSADLSEEELLSKTIKNKDNLHAIRVEVKKMCEPIEKFFDAYSFGDYEENEMTQNQDKISKMEMQLVTEVEKVSLEIQLRMKAFAKGLWEEAIEMLKISPPCKYSFIGLGSIARQEMTPFSDLECALLIEKDSDEIQQYFKNLAYLFHLIVLNLQETPIPEMGIESLNDYLSPGGNKFFDSITPRGFRMDGAMPWASKTPIGRKETSKMETLCLIKTPKEMVELQKEDNTFGQVYHVADILSNSVFICGDSAVFKKYNSLYVKTMSKTDHKGRAQQILNSDYYRSPFVNVATNMSIKVIHNKNFFYRFPSTFVENLRLYFIPFCHSKSSLQVLDHLQENILSGEGAFNLKVHLVLCFGLRILTYFQNNGQYENIVFTENGLCTKRKYKPSKTSNKAANFVNPAPFKRMEAGQNALRDVVERYFSDGSRRKIKDLKREMFILVKSQLQPSVVLWYRHYSVCSNLKWARESGELPPENCGGACCIKDLLRLSQIPIEDHSSLSQEINSVLTKRDCKCLSLVRSSILVSKALLFQPSDEFMPKKEIGEELQENYRHKKYKNVRERHFLLTDISDLAREISDHRFKLSVIDDILLYIIDIRTIKDTQKMMVDICKNYLYDNLVALFSQVGQTEESATFSEIQIHDMEKHFAGFSTQIPIFFPRYLQLGYFKRLCGMAADALHYYQKASAIALYAWENATSNEMAFEQLTNLQEVADALAYMYLRYGQGNAEEVIELLTTAFLGDGKLFHYEADFGITSLLNLSRICFKHYRTPFRANQYVKEVLEIVMVYDMDKLKLKPDTRLEIVEWGYIILLCMEEPEIEPSFMSESFIQVLCKLFEDEALYMHFIDKKKSILKANKCNDWDEPHLSTWIGFFFELCQLSLQNAHSNYERLRFTFNARMTLLRLAEIFCEKVVKQVASKTLHEMCLIFINFNRGRLLVYYSRYIECKTQLKIAFTGQLEIRGRIARLIDSQDLQIADVIWFNQKFTELASEPFGLCMQFD